MTRPEQLEKERLDNINTFIFFTANYPYDFVESIWPGNKHMKEKFTNIYNKTAGGYGVVNKFYFDLDSNNRKILLNWINTNYNKQELHT